MHSIHRFRPSSPMVVAFIALFLAVSGTATAAKLITGKNIARSAITGKHVKDRSLSAADFRGTLAGAAGPAGPEGARGLTGAKGERGPQGDRGEKGEKGDKGDKGEQGEQGEQGVPGRQGEKGDPCVSRDPACKGPTGDQGPPGQKGEPGEQGRQGEQGNPGQNGAQGSPGAPGERGPAGFQTVTVETSNLFVPPRVKGLASATCRSGKLVGGGYSTDETYAPWVRAFGSYPDGNSWKVRLYNDGDTHSFGGTVYAVCAG